MCLGLQFITGVKLFALERQVADLAAPNGYLGMIRVILFRTNFTDNKRMADLLLLVLWNIVILDQEECIGTIDTFCAGRGAGADALTESAKFVCVGLVPCFFVPGVTAELTVLKEFTRC